MSLSLHTLAPAKGARTKSFRVGRGEGSGRGKTSGKGTKGQRSRSGGRNKLKLKGLKQMLLSFPKLRGFKSRYVKAVTVGLDRLSQAFPQGGAIDLQALKGKALVPRSALAAKIVGNEVKGAFKVTGIAISAAAKAAIEKAGGSAIVPKKSKKSFPKKGGKK